MRNHVKKMRPKWKEERTRRKLMQQVECKEGKMRTVTVTKRRQN